MTESSTISELLRDSGAPRQGSSDDDETLIELVQALFPRKPYCLVEDWTIFNVEVTQDELQKIHAAGKQRHFSR